MKTKTLLSFLALAGVAIAQPLSAAARSADSLPQVERTGSVSGEAEGINGSPLIWIVALFAIVGLIIIGTTSGDDPVSP